MKKLSKLLCICFALVITLCSCGNKQNNDTNKAEVIDSITEHTQILFTMDSGKTFTIELYPEYAPKTCANFKKLVEQGFYNGLTFHRIYPGFMAQGGDPLGTGTGGSGENIEGEFVANGFTNTLSHTRGVVSMARAKDYNSASSQFFICYSDDYISSLDGNYAAFGKVIDGMETVDGFTEVELVYNGESVATKPTTPIVIEKAEVIV